jgi:hypothetical protein
MQITFIQAFEDEKAAKRASGTMTAAGYKVYYVNGTDQAQMRGYPAQGDPKTVVIGDIDDKKVFVLLSTKDEVVPNEAAAPAAKAADKPADKPAGK